MATAIAWAPALPPMPETIVWYAARIGTPAIVSWKTLTTAAARNAVPRLTSSQPMRLRKLSRSTGC